MVISLIELILAAHTLYDRDNLSETNQAPLSFILSFSLLFSVQPQLQTQLETHRGTKCC